MTSGKPSSRGKRSSSKARHDVGLEAFEQALREHHERLIHEAVERELRRRAAHEQSIRQVRAASPAKRALRLSASSVRRLLAGVPAAEVAERLHVTRATVQRWLLGGAPAKWRVAFEAIRAATRREKEEAALRRATERDHNEAVRVHLQQALLAGVLPDRTTGEHMVETYRRRGYRRWKTWKWPRILVPVANKLLRWFGKAVPQEFGNWQGVIGYAQLGWLGEEAATPDNQHGYRAGSMLVAIPSYKGPELPYAQEIVVDAWWNSQVHATRAGLLKELADWLAIVLKSVKSGTIVRVDSTELRTFDWTGRKVHE